MHSTQDLRLQRIVKAVRETSKALKKALPERDPVGDLGGERNGTRAGNVLSPHLAAVAAGLDEAQLQPAGRSAKADKHCSGKIIATMYTRQASPLRGGTDPSG